MATTKRLLPLAAMESLMRKSGAQRVSEGAKQAMKEILEKKADELTKRAVQYANHAGRTTIKWEDVNLADKQ